MPSGGLLSINPSTTVTITSGVLYQPPCTEGPAFLTVSGNSTSSVDDYRAHFFASSTPLIYVVAVTTVIAWVLFIVLLILPGGYLGIGRNGTSRWLRSRRLRGTLFDRPSVSNIGSRPWIQNVAAFLVTVALTTVTADTFKEAQSQYEMGYMNAKLLRQEVTGSLEVRIIRAISDLFLWLAQIQTLIRLFPRHKEKLIIKWIGFVLVCLDIIFSCLNSFLINTKRNPRSYQDAIPALSYLFQLALNLLYAAWVLYYALTKRRYAFYHPNMPNISIIALISIVSILIPAVFFLVDILQPAIGAWGDYFRWVGAAASSIVVWEWVERIETLEREEKKDGILGREVFDGDDMFDMTPSDSSLGARHHSQRTDPGPDAPVHTLRPHVHRLGNLTRRWTGIDRARNVLDPEEQAREDIVNIQHRKSHRRKADRRKRHGSDADKHNVPPQPSTSPVDRANTTSANSTLYAVTYHPVINTPPGFRETDRQNPATANATEPLSQGAKEHAGAGDAAENANPPRSSLQHRVTNLISPRSTTSGWSVANLASNLFRRNPNSPPLEIKNALSTDGVDETKQPPQQQRPSSRFGLRDRIASRSEKLDAKTVSQEPTVIPAPPRGQPWSPDQARHPPISEGVAPEHGSSSSQGTTQPQNGNSQQGNGSSVDNENSPASSRQRPQNTTEERSPPRELSKPEGAEPRSGTNISAASPPPGPDDTTQNIRINERT